MGRQIAIQERLSIVEDGSVGIELPVSSHLGTVHIKEPVELLFWDSGDVARDEGRQPIMVTPTSYQIIAERTLHGERLIAIWAKRYPTHPNAVAFNSRKITIARTVSSYRRLVARRKGSSL